MSFYEDAKGAAALGASGGGGGGTDNYEDLNNLPEINGVTLAGNKSGSDLGLESTIEDLSDIRSGAGAGATAVQTIKIGNETQTKTSGVVALPAYPTTLPASDTTSTYSASGTAPVNGTAVASAISGKQDTISDLSSIRSGAEAGATAVQTIQINGATQTKTSGTVNLPAYPTTLPASDTTSSYSATGTAPVNGTAVAAALGTLDVASAGGSGKYIAAISETDGKISATAETMDTVPTANSTKACTSGGIQTKLAAIIDGGEKNLLFWDISSLKTANPSISSSAWNDNVLTCAGNVTITFNTDGTCTLNGTATAGQTVYLTQSLSLPQGDYIWSAGQLQTKLWSGVVTNDGELNYTGTNTYTAINNKIPQKATIYIESGATFSEKTISPMLCTKTAWDISQAFVPSYCPSLYELYQMILNAQ